MKTHGATEAGLAVVEFSTVKKIKVGYERSWPKPTWRVFPAWRWKEGLIAFVNARWRDDQKVRDLVFETEQGHVLTLRADNMNDRYIVFGQTDTPTIPHWVRSNSYSAEMESLAHVEQGLIRLVRSDMVSFLSIWSKNWKAVKAKPFGAMALRKDRGQTECLQIVCENIPTEVNYF